MEAAMSRFTDTQFEVKWKPFQLNSNASQEGVNKMAMYMEKFGVNKQQLMSRMEGMKSTFERAGLPFAFTEDSITGNTFNSHRHVPQCHTLNLFQADLLCWLYQRRDSGQGGRVSVSPILC
eukprot:TRINITY_DN12225_c0_g1_i4.p1 TRINITY_DN12225_c0_g1~~TRINITY_DN12225_c0_g1_i4.p1  ORF type:complete len:121 (+),score=19.11 TRINITY_DN12225_c0_g1_i4:227-589(+)